MIIFHLSSHMINFSLTRRDTNCYQPHFNMIKGVLHVLTPKAPKLACFVLYIKITNIFLKIYAAYRKLFKELKNSIKIKVGQAFLKLLTQKQHFDCFDS